MLKDRFDKMLWLLLIGACAALVILLVMESSKGTGKAGGGLDKAVEREMAYRARIELIGKLYGPVEELQRSGKNQAALLKLDELLRKYPGEAHGHILQGGILKEMGAYDEALSAYVAGIKLNGDYLDEKSPLTRRQEIQLLVDEGRKSITARAAANPGNQSVAASLRKINYLKSRLAGGCE